MHLTMVVVVPKTRESATDWYGYRSRASAVSRESRQPRASSEPTKRLHLILANASLKPVSERAKLIGCLDRS